MERERSRERERQTGRQTDTETETRRDTYRQKDIQREIEIDRHTYKPELEYSLILGAFIFTQHFVYIYVGHVNGDVESHCSSSYSTCSDHRTGHLRRDSIPKTKCLVSNSGPLLLESDALSTEIVGVLIFFKDGEHKT